MKTARCGRGGGDCLTFARHCPLLSENLPGELSREVPLAPLTTLGVGGPAALLARPGRVEEIGALLAALEKYGCPWRVIGRGSNLLVADRGYAGVVILLDRRLGAINPAGREGAKELIRVEAGASLAALLAWSGERGLAGLEFLVGIPGRVGGALLMNAGAWGEELGERVTALELIGPQGGRVLERRQLSFTYRHMEGLEPEELIVAATLALTPADPASIRERMRSLWRQRRGKQPRRGGSAGSFFKNPPGDYAGRLIEQAGLKGLKVGGAMVATEHANFLLNSGGASAADFLGLMELVQDKVAAVSGIKLEPEVHLLGFVGNAADD